MTQFGRDLSCTDSLCASRFVSGATLVAQAAYRRLITPRGALRGGPAEENYGTDLSDYVGAPSNESTAASMHNAVVSELQKDERIHTVSVDVTRSVDGPSSTFLVSIDCTTAEGPFSLQLSVGQVTVGLIGISVGASS